MTKPKIQIDVIKQVMVGIGNPGVCLLCGMFDEYAGCEPDAMNYECPVCGEKELFGLEYAMAINAIEIEEE